MRYIVRLRKTAGAPRPQTAGVQQGGRKRITTGMIGKKTSVKDTGGKNGRFSKFGGNSFFFRKR